MRCALLRPAAALGGAGADEIARSTPVSASSDREPWSCGPRCCREETRSLAVIAASMFNMSRGGALPVEPRHHHDVDSVELVE